MRRSTFSNRPGFRGAVLSSLRGADPAGRRRHQDELDAREYIERGAKPREVREFIRETRGTW